MDLSLTGIAGDKLTLQQLHEISKFKGWTFSIRDMMMYQISKLGKIIQKGIGLSNFLYIKRLV